MFIREIKVRSNNQIKSSDKKNFLKEIVKQYPTVNEEELKELIKIKDSEITLSKIVTHDGADVVVYLVDKIPYFFKLDKDEQLMPTVYFLWKFPHILKKFYTYGDVFGKLANGADLMLPGVIIKQPLNLYTFKGIAKNELCCVCIRGNEAPIAIGKTNLSGEDMYMSAMRGKCLNIIHVYQDSLWAMGDKSIQVPSIAPVENATPEPAESTSGDQTDQTESASAAAVEEDAENVEKKFENVKISDEASAEVETQAESNAAGVEIDHEKVLTDSFLLALKYKSKEIKLPIIVSTFMKIMQTCCPADTQFDLKQTRFKKITTFLKEMESKGCIKTKEFQKGVLSITEISKDNELIKFLKKPEWLKSKDETEAKSEAKLVYEVYELFKVDGNVEEFFKKVGRLRRGDVLAPAQIRSLVTNYVKENNLQDQRFVKLDELLNKAFFSKNRFIDENNPPRHTFDELFAVIFSKMGSMHQIKAVYAGSRDAPPGLEPTIRKGKFQPVEFKLESRAGNKKLTNVYNLAAFEIDSTTLQTRIRKELGCSVSVIAPETAGSAASDDFVISVQGNQIFQVSELLKNEYGIQLKHMSGLDQAIKP